MIKLANCRGKGKGRMRISEDIGWNTLPPIEKRTEQSSSVELPTIGGPGSCDGYIL